MDMSGYIFNPGEKPLDRIPEDGGFCGIFRRIGVIGDSLSSGEFESVTGGVKHYYDMYEYSWGSYIARMTGSDVHIFAQGGMTAAKFLAGFGDSVGYRRAENLAQAYIIALGVNDVAIGNRHIGSVADICREDCAKNGDSFIGDYARIVQKLRECAPDSVIFPVTMPLYGDDVARNERTAACNRALAELAEFFGNVYLIDLARFAPPYDAEFCGRFFLGGHMNPMGYMLTAKMIAAYIDYIIRSDPQAFARAGFIGSNLPQG